MCWWTGRRTTLSQLPHPQDWKVGLVWTSSRNGQTGLFIEDWSSKKAVSIVYLAKQKCVCSVIKRRFTRHHFIYCTQTRTAEALEGALQAEQSKEAKNVKYAETAKEKNDFQYSERLPVHWKWPPKKHQINGHKRKSWSTQKYSGPTVRQSGCLARKVQERGAQ